MTVAVTSRDIRDSSLAPVP